MLLYWGMLVNLGTGILGVLFFLFLFWKKLKEDYSSEIIFKSAFSIIIGILIGWGIALRIYGPFLWLSFLGAILGLIFANSKFKIRFFESLEAVVIAGLPWISLVFLQNSVQTSNLTSFFAFLFILILIFIYYYFDQHYKNFTWYKSGKIGFSGLATLIIIYLTRLVVAILRVGVISFFSYEVIADAVFLALSAGLLIKLGIKKE